MQKFGIVALLLLSLTACAQTEPGYAEAHMSRIAYQTAGDYTPNPEVAFAIATFSAGLLSPIPGPLVPTVVALAIERGRDAARE